MKKLVAAVALSLSFAVPAVAVACEGHSASAELAPKKVTVQQVASLTKEKKATVVDANREEFRTKNGVIPNATLLSNAVQYDPAKELPAAKDTKLVFYCAGEKCSASHQAAEKALGAGYTDVAVMPEGLTGWKKAGQPTTAFQPRS